MNLYAVIGLYVALALFVIGAFVVSGQQSASEQLESQLPNDGADQARVGAINLHNEDACR